MNFSWLLWQFELKLDFFRCQVKVSFAGMNTGNQQAPFQPTLVGETYVTQYNKRYILSTFEKIEIFALSNIRFNKLSNFLLFSLHFTHCFAHSQNKPGRQDVPFVVLGHIFQSLNHWKIYSKIKKYKNIIWFDSENPKLQTNLCW